MTPLTRREYEVVRLFALGKTWDAIAHELGISKGTIEKSRASAKEKLDVDDLTGVWIALGWLHVPDAAESEALTHAYALLALADQLRASVSDVSPSAGSAAAMTGRPQLVRGAA